MMKLGPLMTERELACFQAETARHLSFSLTLACPLRCAHCMVATVAPRDAAAFTMPLDMARDFAAQMQDVATMGVRRISFTGGEPFVARPQLSVLSQAAAAAGIDVTVVTACHWAKTRKAADRLVAAFAGIRRWHLSTDIYHTEYLDPAYLVHAAQAVLGAGGKAHVRMAVPVDHGPAERELIAWVQARLPAGVPITLQPVTPVGRAREIGVTADVDPALAVPDSPCVTTGPLIRHDGQLMPCCSGLSELPASSPFRQADAAAIGLVAAVAAWRDDPLLTLVRSLGFGFPAAWATEAGAALPAPAPRHPCDYCTALWSSPLARRTAQERASQPMTKARIEDLSRAIFFADSHAHGG